MNLNEHQMMVVKGLVKFAEATANQIYHIMQNHGLDKIEGCNLAITVCPEFEFTTRNIVLGSVESDFGYIDLARGQNDEEYTPIGNNSAEYERLFASQALRNAMEEAANREKPLPPDGLWVGGDDNNRPVDGWEWDVNDSLS